MKPQLPPDSMPWGRDVEKRLTALETTSRNLNTQVQGTNAQLGATLSTVGFLSDQMHVVETYPSTLFQYQVVLNSSDDNVANAWFDFDPEYDSQLSFITSNSGRIAYQAGGYVGVFSSGNVRVKTGFGLDLFEGDERIPENQVWYAWDGGCFLGGQGDWHHSFMAATGQYHVTNLKPNTEYLLSSFRVTSMTYDSVAGGTQTGLSYWQGSSINILKIGK